MSASVLARGLVIFSVALAWPVTADAQTTWYVDDVTDPLEDGSILHPYDAIQEGIDASVNGDTVLVLDGTYTGIGNRDLLFDGRLITVRGDNGADTCVIDCEAQSRDQHRAFTMGPGENVVLDGLTIRNGYVGGNGGAILSETASPQIRDCVFADNFAHGTGSDETGNGGAISGTDGNAVIERCKFLGNTAISEGGALTALGGGLHLNGGSPVVRDCEFRDNAALSNAVSNRGVGGGAIVTSDGARVESCVFVGNHADHLGGAVFFGTGSTAEMVQCDLIGNTCDNSGAGVVVFQGFARVIGCRIAGNTADAAVGFHTLLANGALLNSIVAGNYAVSGVGGIGHVTGDPRTLELVNNTVVGNAGPNGGINNFDWQGDGGTLQIDNCIVWGNDPTQVIHDPNAETFVNHSCVDGGWPGTGNIDADPLFVGGPGGDWTSNGVYASETGQTTFFDDSAGWISGELEDQFLNPDLGQFLQSLIVANTETTVTVWGDFEDLGTIGVPYQINDYHVQSTSPVIDTGTNAALPADISDLDDDGDTTEPIPFDLDGNPRIVDGDEDGTATVDMGAYEYQGCDSLAHCPDRDANCDNVVNGLDVAAISSSANFGLPRATADLPRADVNNDGQVNGLDVAAASSSSCFGL